MADLLAHPAVRAMERLPQHAPGFSCLHHSVLVSYWSWRVCRRLGLDARAAARGGLLHDLYLYDSKDKSAHPGWQCFDHPGRPSATRKSLPPSATRSGTSSVPTCGPWAGRCPAPGRRGWWTWWTPSARGWRCSSCTTPAGCAGVWGYSPWPRRRDELPTGPGNLTVPRAGFLYGLSKIAKNPENRVQFKNFSLVTAEIP